MARGPNRDHLSVKYTGPVEGRTRNIYQLTGLSPPVDFRVHNNNIINLERAIRERVFNVQIDGLFQSPPRPDSDHFTNTLKPFLKLLRKHLPSTTVPISHNDFCELYDGRKKVVYMKAAETLITERITKQDSELRAFVKAEKINFDKKSDPAPRVIQPRDPRYNVEVGCYLKPVEHRIYGAIARVFNRSHTVMKGCNAHDRGSHMERKWARFAKPVAIGLDASRFDQHVSETALKWEHSVYNYIYGQDTFLKMLLSWQCDNRGVGYCKDGRLRYNVRGCRMSGDMNTALGNCLLMSAMVWAYCTEKGIDDFELMNDGDDCVLIFEERYLPLMDSVKPWFLLMGFNMKVEEPVFELEKIEFCQSQPVWTEEGYVMVRNPHVALTKDTFSIKPLDNPKVFAKYTTVLGMGGLSLTGGIPIWQDFYSCLIRSGGNIPSKMEGDPTMDTGMMRLAAGMERKYQIVHPRTRYSFWRAFGIDPPSQESVEQEYSKTTVTWGLDNDGGDPFINWWPTPDC